MVYIFKDFYTNFSGAVANKDGAAQQDILISELADLIINDKPNLVGILKGGHGLANTKQAVTGHPLANPPVAITIASSNRKFAEALTRQLPNNPDLQSKVAVLIAHRQGLMKKKANFSNAGGFDPVSAISNGIGSIFNFATASQEKKTAEEQRRTQEDTNRTILMSAIISKTGEKEANYTGLYVVGGILVVVGLAVLLIRTTSKK